MIPPVVFRCEWVNDYLIAFLGLVNYPMDGSMGAFVLSLFGIKDFFFFFVDVFMQGRGGCL